MCGCFAYFVAVNLDRGVLNPETLRDLGAHIHEHEREHDHEAPRISVCRRLIASVIVGHVNSRTHLGVAHAGDSPRRDARRSNQPCICK